MVWSTFIFWALHERTSLYKASNTSTFDAGQNGTPNPSVGIAFRALRTDDSALVPAVKISRRYQKEVTHDPVIVNALMYICKTMHNSVK